MEDMHFLVPRSTLLTLSLSLLELKTRVPTHHLPRCSSSFISQQRESLLSFPSKLLPQREISLGLPLAMEAEATFHGGGAASDLQPQRSGWAWRQQNGKRAQTGWRGEGSDPGSIAYKPCNVGKMLHLSASPPISSPGSHHWPHQEDWAIY